MTDTATDKMTAMPLIPATALPRFETPLVPRNSISGRALVAVVAIMTFLVSITTGGVMLIGSAASEWEADVAREVTIQIVPAPGRDLDVDVQARGEDMEEARGHRRPAPQIRLGQRLQTLLQRAHGEGRSLRR